MAEEQGAFDLKDVAAAINDKMIRRHPHVFGDHAYDDLSAQVAGWEELKAQERKAKAKTGVLDDVPAGLPALTRAVKLTKRAARVGFDWPTAAEVLDKLREETEEIAVEIEAGDMAKAREELGDILFVCANLARKLDVDPEDALRATNAKFTRRFAFIEARAGRARQDAGPVGPGRDGRAVERRQGGREEGLVALFTRRPR
jgi:MazG family protein